MKVAALFLVAAATAASLGNPALAQDRSGRIEGAVASGSAGASIADGLEVTRHMDIQ